MGILRTERHSYFCNSKTTPKHYENVEPKYDFIQDEKGRLTIGKIGENDWVAIAKVDAGNCGYYNLMKKVAAGDMNAAMILNGSKEATWGNNDATEYQKIGEGGPGALKEAQDKNAAKIEETTNALNQALDQNKTPSDWLDMSEKEKSKIFDRLIKQIKAEQTSQTKEDKQ